MVWEMALAFVGTSIDNFIMISILLAAAREPSERRRVYASQYIGLGLLVLISLTGAGATRLIPMKYVRLLGFLPILVGVKGFIHAEKADEGVYEKSALPALWTQVALNLSGGMDNISVYIPLFERFEGWNSLVIMLAVFAGMMGIWCLLAGKIADLSGLRARIQRHTDRLIPAVYILLGVYILFF